MNIQSSQDVILFILFFIPGFIMLKAYGLLIAREKYDFSAGLFEAIAFTCINYAVCTPIIIMMISWDWYNHYLFLFSLSLFLIIFVIPILLVWLYIKIMKSQWAARKSMLDVHKSAWDYFFASGKAKWVIVSLKNGKKIGGRYIDGSFASSYPIKDIYLCEAWRLTPKTFVFERKIDRTGGILILENEILTIEFFN